MISSLADGANLLDIVVASMAVLGAVKSAYNGYVRKSYDRLKAIERVETQMAHVETKQEEMVDAIIALARAQQQKEVAVDPDTVRKNFDRIDRAEEYLVSDGGDDDGGDDTPAGRTEYEANSNSSSSDANADDGSDD